MEVLPSDSNEHYVDVKLTHEETTLLDEFIHTAKLIEAAVGGKPMPGSKVATELREWFSWRLYSIRRGA